MEMEEMAETTTVVYFTVRGKEDFENEGYQLKTGHFLPFWLYGNSTIKQNLRSC
ncbi:MAG: hypothetical protein K8S55_14300 [Phycisphaerae bacterium]|nr:hypothetical protein [Phycisphaerae bacterium]